MASNNKRALLFGATEALPNASHGAQVGAAAQRFFARRGMVNNSFRRTSRAWREAQQAKEATRAQ